MAKGWQKAKVMVRHEQIIEVLKEKLEQRAKQKLQYEKLYWEAHEELVKAGLRNPAIRNDLSHN